MFGFIKKIFGFNKAVEVEQPVAPYKVEAPVVEVAPVAATAPAITAKKKPRGRKPQGQKPTRGQTEQSAQPGQQKPRPKRQYNRSAKPKA